MGSDAGTSALSRAHIAERLRSRTEDLIADGYLPDALSCVQDLVRDFAPRLTERVLLVRRRYEAFRRVNSTDFGEAEQIRATALDLAYEAEDAALSAPATANAGARVDSRRSYFETLWNDPSSVVVRAEGITKSFKSSAFHLEPLSFDLRVGQITGIVGRNASGKTTLLRMLRGEILPDAGSVHYPGLRNKPGDWAGIHRQMAYVPQLPERWHGVLLHNLNFVAAAHKQPGQDIAQLVEWSVSRYDLGRYDQARWDEVSGGYKIRFELVRALVSQPKVLILDEPLAYLDVIARQRFLQDLQAIAGAFANPIPVIVTSQHINEIEAVADQIIFIDGGACRYVGPLSGIADQAKHLSVEVSVLASRDEVMLALDGLGVVHAESTMEGFVLALPKHTDLGQVFQRLRAAFGPRFSAIRDITSSARSLMSGDTA